MLATTCLITKLIHSSVAPTSFSHHRTWEIWCPFFVIMSMFMINVMELDVPFSSGRMALILHEHGLILNFSLLSTDLLEATPQELVGQLFSPLLGFPTLSEWLWVVGRLQLGRYTFEITHASMQLSNSQPFVSAYVDPFSLPQLLPHLYIASSLLSPTQPLIALIMLRHLKYMGAESASLLPISPSP
jgi:hypothetical protein